MISLLVIAYIGVPAFVAGLLAGEELASWRGGKSQKIRYQAVRNQVLDDIAAAAKEAARLSAQAAQQASQAQRDRTSASANVQRTSGV